MAANARHLSENTILDYQNTFNKFVPFMGPDVEFDSIKREDIERFLASFTRVTNRTLLHYYTALAAVWTWATREQLASTHIIHSVTPPKPEQREVIPFTETEFKLLLSSSS